MVAIYLDSADLVEMFRLKNQVQGFTTNPTLMRKVGVTNYLDFARNVLQAIQDKPVSFEVISDDFGEMERQARLLASLAPNVYVKIPITNTKGESSVPLIGKLTEEGIKANVTAVMTRDQINAALQAQPAIISVFAGRILDTGSQVPIRRGGPSQFLWASAREVCHVYDAESLGYNIITLPPDLLAKLDLKGKDLTEYSRETVQMFYNDAQKAGYTL